MPAYRRDLAWRDRGSTAAAAEEEPLYGKVYLPRKFKMAVGLPGDNCVDLYAQDLGLMAVCKDFRVVGYNVLVGGGMGWGDSHARTPFPSPEHRMALVRPEQAADALRAILHAVSRLRQPRGPQPRAY